MFGFARAAGVSPRWQWGVPVAGLVAAVGALLAAPSDAAVEGQAEPTTTTAPDDVSADEAPEPVEGDGAGDGADEFTEARAIYQSDCAVCHGADAEGTPRARALTGDGLALVYYTLSTGRMPIDDPDEEITRDDPAYDEATIDELVEYIGELQGGAVADGPAIPDVDVEAGDMSEGSIIWRQECAACHAWSGAGGAMLHRATPDVRDATPEEVATSVRAGPLEMPEYSEEHISEQELNSLVAYIDGELSQPGDPGGWSLGHFGPVVEGGVALIVGVGVLMVVTRLIGAGREHR